MPTSLQPRPSRHILAAISWQPPPGVNVLAAKSWWPSPGGQVFLAKSQHPRPGIRVLVSPSWQPRPGAKSWLPLAATSWRQSPDNQALALLVDFVLNFTVSQLRIIGVFRVQAQNRLIIYLTKLADFSSSRFVDFLATTGAPPEWRPEADIMK